MNVEDKNLLLGSDIWRNQSLRAVVFSEFDLKVVYRQFV